MQAKDVMTTPVVTVAPDAPVQQVCAMLLAHRISGVFVVDHDGQLLGTVGDGDLLHRYEVGTDTGPSGHGWWRRWTEGDPGPAAYVRSHGGHARDVMSPHHVAVEEDTPVAEIATLLEQRHIRRVPVLRAGYLVGTVTRADLVRALARNVVPSVQAVLACDDAGIRERLARELAQQSWWRSDLGSFDVSHGVVSYHGLYERESERDAARVAAENTPGVRAVEDLRSAFSVFQGAY